MRYVASILACSLIPAAAFADTTGFYFGGDVGTSTEHFDASNLGVNADNTGYKIAAGFRPFSLIAAEVDYVSFGRASAGFDYADTDGVTVSALAFLPIPIVDIYGRLGAINYRVDAHAPGVGFHRDGTNLTYGVGAGAHWGSLGARLEYERFEIPGATTVSLATIGVNWNFGWP